MLTNQQLHTPALTIAAKGFADHLKESDERLASNWKKQHREICPKCVGTGNNVTDKDSSFCIACEGTGVWFTQTWGHEDGVAFAYIEENGLDFIREACKLHREAHACNQMAGIVGNKMGIQPFLCPKFLEMELTARGYTPKQFYSGEFAKEIAQIVANEYPDFLCVNYRTF